MDAHRIQHFGLVNHLIFRNARISTGNRPLLRISTVKCLTRRHEDHKGTKDKTVKHLVSVLFVFLRDLRVLRAFVLKKSGIHLTEKCNFALGLLNTRWLITIPVSDTRF
tara:strand:- start:466 stop:792 length:327 start_codon:yes stop_codon:yes gene_type:complete